jgi:hypothetical protein
VAVSGWLRFSERRVTNDGRRDDLGLVIADYFIKPRTWYRYTDLTIAGYRMIANKEDQRQAGALEVSPRPPGRERQFGLNPITPYRDYYGRFLLETKLLPAPINVKFAIGYTSHTKLATADDYAKFSWLRLCAGNEQLLYPSLALQKQLLDYLRANSAKPRLVITRVYQDLQFKLYQELTERIMAGESGKIAGRSAAPDDYRR